MHIRHDHFPPNPISICQHLKRPGHRRCFQPLGMRHIREWLCLPCSAAARRLHTHTANLTVPRRTCTWRHWRDVVPWSSRGCKPRWGGRWQRGETAKLGLSSWRNSPSDAALCLSTALNNLHIPWVANRRWTRRTCDPSPPQLDSASFVGSTLFLSSGYLFLQLHCIKTIKQSINQSIFRVA